MSGGPKNDVDIQGKAPQQPVDCARVAPVHRSLCVLAASRQTSDVIGQRGTYNRGADGSKTLPLPLPAPLLQRPGSSSSSAQPRTPPPPSFSSSPHSTQPPPFFPFLPRMGPSIALLGNGEIRTRARGRGCTKEITREVKYTFKKKKGKKGCSVKHRGKILKQGGKRARWCTETREERENTQE